MQWTPKVEARGRLAAGLKARAATTPLAKLTMRDLDALITYAEAARAADNDQQAQLADASVARSARAAEARSLVEHDRDLRDLSPAVVADLEAAGNAADAALLQRVTFARFRQRELEPTGASPTPSDEEAEIVRRVARVEREDTLSRARGLSGYCAFLLAPGREAIAAAFAARSVTREALEAMRATAESVVARGPNLPAPVEATLREHDAVVAQQRVWSAVRRLVRAAVKDDPALSQLFLAC